MGIELGPAEIDEYMLSSPRCILCISREGKSPLALPMWFGWIDGKIYIRTLLTSKKVAAIRKNPRVSCLVESGEQYFSLKAVLFMGECEVIDEQEEARRYENLIFESKRIYKELFPEHLPPHLASHYEKPLAVLRITPTGIISWDFDKVRR